MEFPKKLLRSACPACQLPAADTTNEITLLMEEEGVYVVECQCGGLYFCMDVGGENA